MFAVSQEEANSFRDDEFHLPTIPSEDWQMNVFLNELADELTAEDLKKMKNLLSGELIHYRKNLISV